MANSLALLSLAAVMVASMAIGLAAHRVSERGGFLRGYFLGNRGLGPWAMALTATVMSGGTFMGFPSFVYRYGWVVALWIASYMVVPMCTFAVIGKRMGQLGRRTGAITLPDLLRERFQSPTLAAVASGFLIFILAVSLTAQFKAGAIILQKVLPGSLFGAGAGSVAGQSPEFLSGLIVFSAVVVTYTIGGGFLAAVWTDVFQSILMAVGVLILFPLALVRAGGIEAGTMAGVAQVGEGFAWAPGAGRAFLPVSLAFSMFCMWSIAGMGQPATLVRLMAFRDTPTLRRAMFMLAIYNTLIYLPLVFTFICARAILPPLERTDEAMPTLALAVAHPIVSGLILAAPFGAVMATVSAFLVQISSALVQDIYHRWIDPRAPAARLRLLSRLAILFVALLAAGGTLASPPYLQTIIVFTGGSAACAYLVPCLMACFWPRATARGALAALVGGVLTVFGLYVAGIFDGTATVDPGIGEEMKSYPVYLLGLAPIVWGLLASAVLGIGVSLLDRPPKRDLVARFFPVD